MSHLQVVPEGAKAPTKKQPKSITEALSGTSRDVLWAMRKALAKKLDDGEVSSNAIASAYKEMRELDRLIRLIEAAEKDDDANGTPADEAFDASAV